MCRLCGAVARMHNAMGIFAPLDTGTMSFHQRPYRVLGAGGFAKAVSDEIRDPQLRKIYESVGPIGSIDQFVDSTNLLMRSQLRTRLCVLGRSLLKLPASRWQAPGGGRSSSGYLIQMASVCRLRHALRGEDSRTRRAAL